ARRAVGERLELWTTPLGLSASAPATFLCASRAMSLAAISALLLAAQLAAEQPTRQPGANKAPPRLSAEAFDEDAVAGHPDGEPPALPKQVNWSLEKAEVLATSRLRRLSLAGPWRFAAMQAR